MPNKTRTLKMRNVSKLMKPPETDRQATRLFATNSAEWRAIREKHLCEEPMCRHCAKRGVETFATVVDHINGRADRIEDYDDSNLQSLCDPCHSRKTAREDGSFGRKRVIKDATPPKPKFTIA